MSAALKADGSDPVTVDHTTRHRGASPAPDRMAAQARADLAPPAEPRLAASVAKALILFAALAGGVLLLRRSGTDLVHRLHPDAAGAAALVFAGAAMTACGMPRQILAFAGGSLFGVWTGGTLALAGQAGGCVLDLLAARSLAASLANRLLTGASGRRTRQVLEAHPFTATLTLRLLPVGNNTVLNLLAGAARVRLAPFLAATMLGYLPQTAVFALAGSGTRVGRETQLALGVVMAVLAAALGYLLYRRVRHTETRA